MVKRWENTVEQHCHCYVRNNLQSGTIRRHRFFPGNPQQQSGRAVGGVLEIMEHSLKAIVTEKDGSTLLN